MRILLGGVLLLGESQLADAEGGLTILGDYSLPLEYGLSFIEPSRKVHFEIEPGTTYEPRAWNDDGSGCPFDEV